MAGLKKKPLTAVRERNILSKEKKNLLEKMGLKLKCHGIGCWWEACGVGVMVVGGAENSMQERVRE